MRRPQATTALLGAAGLDPGVTKDYPVELEPGEYLYSCPLNTMPDYKLLVEG
ncbi:MAG: hypothetical protein AAF495_20350 [Pseudomonadota bacterium]